MAGFCLLVAIPLLIVMKISLSEMEATSVSSMISWTNGLPTLKLNFANYQFIFTDALYVKTYISSIKYALDYHHSLFGDWLSVCLFYGAFT